MTDGSPTGGRMRNIPTDAQKRRLRSKILAAEKLTTGSPDKNIKPFMAGATTRCRPNGQKSNKHIIRESAIVARNTGAVDDCIELQVEPRRHAQSVMIPKGPGSTIMIPAVVRNGDIVSVIDCEVGWRYKGDEYVKVVRSDGTEGYIQKFHLDVTTEFGARFSWQQPKNRPDLLPECKMTRERIIKEGTRAPYKYYSPSHAPLGWVRDNVKTSTRSVVTSPRHFDPYN
eukprot:TRINITY_DN15913_c0_g1_i1.p1 TRINITY_DN15913_c0_g1~~TRINITY_DN15913_c0_g1_i1.p1  ORF type:complete len:228 (+),score=26.27 TRINITY_DN15913_c0_g1_i1:53-736(+)